ncbi:MAG TPA: hypothetical protein VD913_02020 [bacterium]|nr:hypothetical protein [bacterium]
MSQSALQSMPSPSAYVPPILKKKKHFSIFFISLLILSLAGSFLLFWAMGPYGIGANSDSANYIAGARNILSGHGYRNYRSLSPITHWPPFFSFSLAVIGLLGIDPLEGARLLHTFLFGINIFMVGIILYSFTRSIPIALLGGWLMLTSKAMLTIHSWACSEPWFILLTFSALYLLIEYLGGKSRGRLITSAVLTGLACIDRYVGIALVGSGTMILFLLSQKRWMRRLADGIAYAVISIFPLGIWFLRNRILTDHMTDRKITPHLPSPLYIRDVSDTFSAWVLSPVFSYPLRIAALVVFTTLILGIAQWVIRHETKKHSFRIFTADPKFRLTASMAIFMACYGGLHWIHQLTVNASVTADDRHFSPIFVAGLITSLVIVSIFLKQSRSLFLRRAVSSLLVLWAFSSFYTSTSSYARIHKHGSYFTGRVWKTSPTVIALNTLPPDAFIYSNEPAIIYLNTSRRAWRLPGKYSRRQYRDPNRAKPKTGIDERTERVKRKLIDKNGYVVFFKTRHKWSNVPESELEKYLPLVLVNQLPDGTIYEVDPGQRANF